MLHDNDIRPVGAGHDHHDRDRGQAPSHGGLGADAPSAVPCRLPAAALQVMDDLTCRAIEGLQFGHQLPGEHVGMLPVTDVVA